MLPVRMGHRDSELEDRSGAAHSLHVEWVQGHPALSVHARWHVSAGSPRGRGAAARPAARPAAAPPCLGSSFSFSRVPGPGAYLTVKKGTGFFCRTPTSSKLKVARDC